MNKNYFIPVLFIGLLFFSLQTFSQKSSIIVLGDIHYDLPDDHDLDWLNTKPDDLRQVREYTMFTEKYWSDFMTVIKAKSLTVDPPVQAVIQVGDLSEGLAGTEELARQMASNTMKAVETAAFPVPWLLSKGNHDVTGPGSVDAFNEFYVPMIRKQTNNPKINNASYSYSYNNVQIVVADTYDKNIDLVNFLDNELSNSDATIKFVVIHEPIIPVTERCWHTLRKNPLQRGKLLEVIAKNKAIVLCGHLHRYSVVSRNTDFGPVVQLMVLSVVRDRSYQVPKNVITQYGPSLAEAKHDWQPETLEERKAILKEEAKHVTFYKQTDLPGYAILRIDDQKETVDMEYYSAFGSEPYDKINLSELLNKN
jgi:hypothetical protein